MLNMLLVFLAWPLMGLVTFVLMNHARRQLHYYPDYQAMVRRKMEIYGTIVAIFFIFGFHAGDLSPVVVIMGTIVLAVVSVVMGLVSWIDVDRATVMPPPR
ncbi:MAG TPA: hypothetical protein VGB97_02485 [Candidatus Paceibacterota bacterium]|jgi:phosphatidylglycerophosphate synthase